MSPEALPPDASMALAPPPLRRTLIALGLLYLVELWGYGSGFASLLTAFIGLILLGIGSLLALLQKRQPMAVNRIVRAGIYLSLGLLALLTARFQNATTQRRADQVAAACRPYQAEQSAYPRRLEDLIPRYLAEIPHPKSTLFGTPFYYTFRSSEPDALPMLWYGNFPGGPRRSYRWDTGRWSSFS
jgi:hypothetical protein